MLTFLYPISYVVCLLSLIGWFYFQENRKIGRLMSVGFLGFFALYVVSLAFADAEFSQKLFVIFRDLGILAVVVYFFGALRKNILAFCAMLVLLIAGIKFYYFDVLTQTFQNDVYLNESVPLNDDGELLMELKEGEQISELLPILDKYDVTYKRAFPEIGNPNVTDLDDYYLLNVGDKYEKSIKRLMQELHSSGLIDWVEGNEDVKVDDRESKSTSSKKKYGSLNDPGISNLWGFDKMKMDEFYSVISDKSLKPKRKALIAILDTGVDAKHEDLSANFKSIKKKYDNDPHGHGTHCAGIAAAVSNNGKGIASYSLDNRFTQVTSVKVLSGSGMGTQAGIINGIIFAADKGASVISMSLGGRSSDSKQRAYKKAVKYANDKGAIVVVAAGNESTNATNISPANTPGVITVSAIDPQMNKAYFSNEVQDLKMGIAAPGVNIYSTIPNNKYASFNGTSMATPYVAGLVGLMKSFNPNLTTKEVYKILHDTGIKTNGGQTTGHLIHPKAALNLVLD